MAITTVKQSNDGAGEKVRAVPTGHWVIYLLQPRIFQMYDPNGNKVAETGVPDGVRDFSAFIAPNGEVQVIYSSFNNDQNPWPFKKWTTGAFVGAATPAPPAPPNNAAVVAAIRAKLAELAALVDSLA